MRLRITRRRYAFLVFLIAALAFCVRLESWSLVFRGGEVRLLPDVDPLYHVLQAERILANAPGAPWFDPAMDFPFGAAPIWPPLFDAVVAGLAFARSGADVTRDEIAATGAVLTPLLGALTVLAVAGIARIVAGRPAAVAAAILFAVLPIHVEFTHVGRVDQHAAEILIYCFATLALLQVARRGSRMWLWLLVAAQVLAFWNWQGSALLVALLLTSVSVEYIASRDRAVTHEIMRPLGVATGAAAVVLALTILIVAAPGTLTTLRLTGLTGFQVLTLLTASVYCAVAVFLDRKLRPAGRGRRLAVTAVAAALSAAAAICVPGARAAVIHGFTALAGANFWYESIPEFDPLLFAGYVPLRDEVRALALRFGPLVLAPIAALLVLAWGRLRPRRLELALIAATVLLIPYVLMFYRNRFAGYATPALAIAGAILVAALSSIASRGLRYASMLAFFAAVLLHAVFHLWSTAPNTPLTEAEIAAIRWVGAQHAEVNPAVLATWSDGHAVQYYAGRPVMATSFGTDLGWRGLRDEAQFLFAMSEESADEVLQRRRVGTILLRNPVEEMTSLAALAPGAAPAPRLVRSWREGYSIEMPSSAFGTVASRLYFDEQNGAWSRSRQALSRFRLVLETVRTSPGELIHDDSLKVFGVVEGARVHVHTRYAALPIAARIPVVTNTGRRFWWQTSAVTDERGLALLRVPYATGANGASTAGTLEITDGARVLAVRVDESAAANGGDLVADLR